MKQNNLGEMIFSETDVCDLLMQGRSLESLQGMIVENTVDFTNSTEILNTVLPFVLEQAHSQDPMAVHRQFQKNWHMPTEYKEIDIAQYVLSLCTTQEQLQRCGQELLMFQERDLFDLLRYLKYLVDVMTQNQIIWGVGRGSSVSSYVLYKLGVHRVDSMFYDLSPDEFLR
jgi:DNA polymerase III alpha subunit